METVDSLQTKELKQTQIVSTFNECENDPEVKKALRQEQGESYCQIRGM